MKLDSTELVSRNTTQGSTVYPDIIVHKRGKTENLLAIEIKKTNGDSEERDIRKLIAIRKELKYSYGLFLRFDTGSSGSGINKVQWSVE